MKKMLTMMVVAGMAVTTTAQAAAPVLGAITSGQGALVARNGRLLPATVNMQLLAGDKVITRSNGSAKVALKGNCNVAVNASSMLPVDGACGAPVSFDQGRAGYAGSSSAALQGTTLVLAVIAGGAAIAGIVAAASGGDSAPTSP